MTKVKTASADPRPNSAVSTAVGVAGLVGLALWIYIARNFGTIAASLGYPGFPERADGAYSALLAVAACGLPMVLWSLCVDKVHRRQSTGLEWALKRPVADVLDTSIIKIAGLWATWAGIAALYMLCRWYWAGNYLFSMEVFTLIAIPLVIASAPHAVWLDRSMANPRAGGWHVSA
ncbi:MAG TPA: protein-S-isoprenylcysteine methyltransferase, partial [Sphingorhabdus sp.]|nr:protein-S-isoprenylcysteine methyltransferase [Sphingorhabdus sp.]